MFCSDAMADAACLLVTVVVGLGSAEVVAGWGGVVRGVAKVSL